MDNTAISLAEDKSLTVSVDGRPMWYDHYIHSDEDVMGLTVARQVEESMVAAQHPGVLNPEEGFDARTRRDTVFGITRGELLRRTYQVPDSSISLQKWEGVVTSVGEEFFLATLTDLMGAGPDEATEISFDEVPKGDIPLITEGAVFYLNVGYDTAADGQVRRSTILRFRRLPSWSKSEIKKAKEKSSAARKFFGWD